jgi:hypothetical protein
MHAKHADNSEVNDLPECHRLPNNKASRRATKTSPLCEYFMELLINNVVLLHNSVCC